ncbi:recombinase family protein [Falcatimonas sp. MSJ-15]|uniref:recombinase family protein n=1 Tax=Falcatimonas sp. MSJ-15 TaxID=2841515 RepID=UPI001C0FF16E|nr:recombinase family protein [Falcatimonas sp. MSJ-15]MBU5471632.1 recombinase family protein [Falcatimonas sp. MSJ-15]
MAKRKVTTIPATINKFTAKPVDSKKKRRVAGYARVSTDHEDQQTSYEAQVDYYTNYIKGRDDWEFAGLYSDEGISATNTKHRDGFNQMIADALAGKIDLIITKSVSRFARNTVDSLTTIRKLKEHNIECYFEKENIWTFDSKGELLLTIMSSLAQEESRSISENVTWGHRKRFADGKVSFAYSRVMGLDKGSDGQIIVNKEQAEVVKLLFRLFLNGMTPHAIAAELTKRGIKSPSGKDKWNQGTVRRMLSNEKYKGDALLQKEFTVDFLTKKHKKNEGEVPQYYVEGNHEAIISPQVFDLVQAELERRKRTEGTRYSGVTIFSNKIKCGDCGGWYGSKVWHSTDQYRKVIYRCNHKYKNEKCQTPHVTEDEVKALFVKAYNELLSEKNDIIANAEIIFQTLCTTDNLLEEKQRLEDEILILVEMTQNIVAENARVAQDQEEYQKRYDGLVQRYEAAKKEYDELAERIEQKEAQGERMRQFIKTLQKQEGIITEFDETLWGGMVDYVTIGKEERSVTFKDGTEITVE